MAAEREEGQSRTRGAQTLARGLRVLKFVAAADDGVTIGQVADFAQIHRSMAYRILEALVDSALVTRAASGRYYGASGLLALGRGGYAGLRQAGLEPVQTAANQLGVTLALLVAEGAAGRENATAVLVCAPATLGFHITFAEGSSHPLHLGAAGAALTAILEGGPLETHYTTYGEVEPYMYGLAVPVVLGGSAPAACLVAISQRETDPERFVPVMTQAVEQIVTES
ncbi:helix-turn-helix domain-containing protein [Micrococcoides hystricis]|uniref:Helix-turn-helix domain-containing protein n=1 Tax=Micrococcoides hystricis TaxID=1572761 RepID=A0ABV6PDS3_9MICC